MGTVTPTNRLNLICQILAGTGSVASATSLLEQICTVFQFSGAGIRWPADGPARLEVEQGSNQGAIRYPLHPAGERPGLFWIVPENNKPTETDHAFFKLLAQALARSPYLISWLGSNVEAIRNAQRLDDAGRVAGRIAHDFDNVLLGTVGFAQLAQGALPPNHPAYAHLTESIQAAQAGVKYCQQLHQLGRAGTTRPVPSDIGSILTREKARLETAFPKVLFDFEIPKGFSPVAIENGALGLIFSHLLDNAAEASPTGGTVSVTMEKINLSEEEARNYLGSASAGEHALIHISDQGPGIGEESRRRLFVEPFFTTKFRHRGLGLPVVYRILYAHRGGVRIDSAPHQGTTVHLVLPLAITRGTFVSPTQSTTSGVNAS